MNSDRGLLNIWYSSKIEYLYRVGISFEWLHVLILMTGSPQEEFDLLKRLISNIFPKKEKSKTIRINYCIMKFFGWRPIDTRKKLVYLCSFERWPVPNKWLRLSEILSKLSLNGDLSYKSLINQSLSWVAKRSMFDWRFSSSRLIFCLEMRIIMFGRVCSTFTLRQWKLFLYVFSLKKIRLKKIPSILEFFHYTAREEQRATRSKNFCYITEIYIFLTLTSWSKNGAVRVSRCWKITFQKDVQATTLNADLLFNFADSEKLGPRTILMPSVGVALITLNYTKHPFPPKAFFHFDARAGPPFFCVFHFFMYHFIVEPEFCTRNLFNIVFILKKWDFINLEKRSIIGAFFISLKIWYFNMYRILCLMGIEVT